MEYGLRRYEATQRLLWFLFFLACLAIAYRMSNDNPMDFFGFQTLPVPFRPDAVRSSAFWMQSSWLKGQPLAGITIYVLWVAVLFLGGRLVWLLVQVVGKFLINRILVANVKNVEVRPGPAAANASSLELGKLFPAELLLRKINHLPLQLIFHSFQRLRLMLGNPHRTLSSEELMEKERRIVETDWHILWSSWTPFRWLLWLLPLLGTAHALWLLYTHLQPAFSGQKDLQDFLGPVLTGLLPLVQLIALTILFSLASGLLKRFENLYLSSVDGLLYDRFLSRLPFQSSDTLIILDALERQFKELHAVVKRLEQAVAGEDRTQGLRG